MEEEKKRRPRLSKSDMDSPLEERTKSEQSEDPFIEKQDKPADRPDRSQGAGGFERKPWQDRSQGTGGGQGGGGQGGGGNYERKPWQDRSQGTGGGQGGGGQGSGGNYERKPWQDRSQGTGGGQGGGGNYERRPYQDRSQGGGGQGSGNRPYQQRSGGGGNFGRKPFRKNDDFFVERKPKPNLPSGEGMPLNKYLAHCGLSSRRKAVEYVENGKVTVNGELKKEPFYRIQPGDIVICDSKLMRVQERMVYVLLNKPKNVITTTDDDRGRVTVIDIVDSSFPERIFPVGRLDRDTTGLVLLTNDGELAQKLTHPSFAVQKQYRVGLRRGLTPEDLAHIERGVELDDGLMEVNWIRFSEDHPDRDIVELEISSGRNRVVRRIFETLGYEIFKLDRFYFAGLTKKDLERGKFRELTQREVVMLKHFTGHPSTGKKKKGEEGETPEETSGGVPTE